MCSSNERFAYYDSAFKVAGAPYNPTEKEALEIQNEIE